MNTLLLVYPALVTWLAVAVYFWLAVMVAKARTKHGVRPPFTEGPEEFLRYFRVHQNTTEALWLFLPSLWLFAIYLSPLWAGILGLIWVVGRVVYALGYYRAWEKRMPGFILNIFVVVVLMLGALYGIINAWLAH